MTKNHNDFLRSSTSGSGTARAVTAQHSQHSQHTRTPQLAAARDHTSAGFGAAPDAPGDVPCRHQHPPRWRYTKRLARFALGTVLRPRHRHPSLTLHVAYMAAAVAGCQLSVGVTSPRHEPRPRESSSRASHGRTVAMRTHLVYRLDIPGPAP